MQQTSLQLPVPTSQPSVSHPNVPKVSRILIDEIPISQLDTKGTLKLLRSWLSEDVPRQVATANLDFLRLARLNPSLRLALRQAALVTADGAPLVWLSKLQGGSLSERVTGSDMTPLLLEIAAKDGRSVFFLGGQDGVAEEAANRMRLRYPGLRVAGTSEVIIDWEDPRQAGRVADQVRASGADLLLVALGCPKQELFLSRYLDRTGARVGIGVGATLDFLAGRVNRANPILGRIGLEWVYRMLQEPKRLVRRYTLDLLYLASLGLEQIFKSKKKELTA